MARPTPQEIQDLRDQPKIDAAYDRALTSPEMVSPPPPKKPAKEPVKKANGGYVKAADGCAQRGKTRGKMV